MFSFLWQRTVASDTLVINKSSDLDNITVTNQAAFFEDKSGKMPWQQVARQAFAPMNGRPLTWFDTAYGKRRVTIWFRFTLQNNMKGPADLVLLFYPFSYYRETVIVSAGDTIINRPNYFFSPALKAARTNIAAKAAPGETLTYFICMYNPFANLTTITLRSTEAYKEYSEGFFRQWFPNFMAKIMFLAIIAFITLHTLTQYITRRRREFGWYTLYSFSLFLLFLHNIEFQQYFNIFFSWFPYLHRQASMPLYMIVSYLYLRFAREYVDFKSLAPWYYKVIIWTERVVLATIPVHQAIDIAFNDYYLSKDIYVGLRMALFPISFIAVYLLLRSGQKALYFFGVGTLLLSLGLVSAMVFFYFPGINPIPAMENIWYMEIGVVLELLCFTAGLSYKTRLIEVDKQNTQQQLIGQLEKSRQLQDEINVKLETRANELSGQVMSQQQQLEKEKERQLTLEFTKKIAEMELQLLKLQLNPHFYFNTLNNLYGLAMIAPKKAPDAILKLSDIMEYVIYDCRQDKVPLAKEIKFLKSYIELEKLRYHDKAAISMDINGKPDNRYISPMLLIQFVENAFKHGMEQEKCNSFLRININIHSGSLEYESANSINDQSVKNGGVGLTNVKKRLDLLYPQKHDLQVMPGEQEYRVKLKLTL
jgi:hypothetical protein